MTKLIVTKREGHYRITKDQDTRRIILLGLHTRLGKSVADLLELLKDYDLAPNEHSIIVIGELHD